MNPTRWRRTISRLCFLFLAGLLAATGLWAQTSPAGQGRRLALVVGNSTYLSNPLTNPANDATDIAAALKAADFSVTLVTDADSAAMDQAVAQFARDLKGADTGLFYYAGHGVQVDGVNFLIPVSPRIDDAATAKAKSLAVDTVVAKMEQSGVRTALVFLDSCRDNPFPGASRSGTRGLALVPTPKTMNSLIAYATSPGDTAADGTGRNGVFSGAVLRYLQEPGLELASLMKSVKAQVAQDTANKQNPRVDDGMKEDWYFLDPAVAAAKAQAASQQAQNELDDLERQLAERQRQIAASKNTSQRQKLEVEQQRQQALQAAKKLEADNLKADAARQAKAAEEARQIAAQRAANAQADRQKQDDLSNLAASRRAELDKLAKDGASDNPDILIETVERLEKVLAEVDGQYAAALQKSQAASNTTWDKQLAALNSQEPDITETDAEFNVRIKQASLDLEQQRQAELGRLKDTAEAQRSSQTASIRQQFQDTLHTLQTKAWTLGGSSLVLSPGSFDRNARTWPFTVTCTDPSIPLLPQTLVADLNQASDPKQAIKDLDTAIKAQALAAELDWGITRQADKARYTLDLRAVRVRNLTNNQVVAQTSPMQRLAYFTQGKRTAPTAAVGTLTVTTKDAKNPGEVWVNGAKVGSTPWTGKLAEGQVKVEVKFDQYAAIHQQTATLEAGKSQSIVANKKVLQVGDVGPAGGLIFYDKGNVSDGWRYLECAPADVSAGVQWYNGDYMGIKTDTAIGTGKANTAAIMAAQGIGQYAASLCDTYTLNRFDDWFLPSKDELNEMYNKLKKTNIGGLASSSFWSSSQDDYPYNDAWGQYFDNGNQNYYRTGDWYRVRPVRAF